MTDRWRGTVAEVGIMETETFILTIAFAVIAMVYAAVGQAGASGYIAAMGLAGL